VTLIDAIRSFPGLDDVPENYLTKVLTDRSVTDGTVDYTLSLKATAELCAADCYMAIVASPDFSEGKYSQKMSRGYMMSQAQSLYANNGEAANANRASIGRGYAKEKWW